MRIKPRFFLFPNVMDSKIEGSFTVSIIPKSFLNIHASNKTGLAL